MKNILKIVLTILLFTPGSFAIPATLIIGIVHHVSDAKVEMIEKIPAKKSGKTVQHQWTRILYKKVNLHLIKTKQKEFQPKSPTILVDHRLLAKLK